MAWLAVARLHTHANGPMALRTVLDSTILFPFRLSPVFANRLVAVSNRLDVLRHNSNDDLIFLRHEGG